MQWDIGLIEVGATEVEVAIVDEAEAVILIIVMMKIMTTVLLGPIREAEAGKSIGEDGDLTLGPHQGEWNPRKTLLQILSNISLDLDTVAAIPVDIAIQRVVQGLVRDLEQRNWLPLGVLSNPHQALARPAVTVTITSVKSVVALGPERDHKQKVCRIHPHYHQNRNRLFCNQKNW